MNPFIILTGTVDIGNVWGTEHYMEPNTVSYFPFSDVSELKISFERLEAKLRPITHEMI